MRFLLFPFIFLLVRSFPQHPGDSYNIPIQQGLAVGTGSSTGSSSLPYAANVAADGNLAFLPDTSNPAGSGHSSTPPAIDMSANTAESGSAAIGPDFLKNQLNPSQTIPMITNEVDDSKDGDTSLVVNSGGTLPPDSTTSSGSDSSASVGLNPGFTLADWTVPQPHIPPGIPNCPFGKSLACCVPYPRYDLGEHMCMWYSEQALFDDRCQRFGNWWCCVNILPNGEMFNCEPHEFNPRNPSWKRKTAPKKEPTPASPTPTPTPTPPEQEAEPEAQPANSPSWFPFDIHFPTIDFPKIPSIPDGSRSSNDVEDGNGATNSGQWLQGVT